jgi:hypothetical protein
MNNRLELDIEILIHDFKDFYLCKEQLTDYCRSEDFDDRGGKIGLSNGRTKIMLSIDFFKPSR